MECRACGAQTPPERRHLVNSPGSVGSPTIISRERQEAVFPIKDCFTHDGFHFSMVKRVGNVALFRKTKPNHSRLSFEVVIIKTHPAKTLFGRTYPARESMPPSEQWGQAGWSYLNREAAERRFARLTEPRLEGPNSGGRIPIDASETSRGVSVATEGDDCPFKDRRD